MCGIAGYFNFHQRLIHSNHEVRNMLNVQQHRGPDDSGICFFNLAEKRKQDVTHKHHVNVDQPFDGVLGFNRLSIVDLSHHGHQPMTSADGNVVLCFNGEIYNAFEYRDQLLREGYSFRSSTDTEVILNLYLKYGFDSMIEKLNGMFAIVIVDLNVSEVIIARDRFGIKPLYYYKTEKQIGFSSELKSFYHTEGFRAELQSELLHEYMLFRGTQFKTLIKGVESLPPGHSMRFNKSGILSIKPFFNVNNYQRTKDTIKLSHAKESLYELLSRSVQSQLMSDVQLGCQLSGGVDSSMITALANQSMNGEFFESFSIVFDNPRFTEKKYIDQVSQKLNLKAHHFTLEPGYYITHLDKVTWHLETPINHPNTIGIYLLAQRAKEFVTVLLSGEGADEVFGGYARFRQMKYPYGMPFLKAFVKQGLNAFPFLSDYLNHRKRAVTSTSFMTAQTARLLFPSFSEKAALDERLSLYDSMTGSVFDKQVKFDMVTYLPDLLIRQDKMSMAHSVENRVPFLDNNVFKGSFAIPEGLMLKRAPNHEKFLLKELCSNVFGRQFAYRNKVGFGIPLKDFFSSNDFSQRLCDDLIPGIKKRAIFDGLLIESMFKNIERLNYREVEALWVMITMEIWLRQFIDHRTISTDK